MVKPNLFSIIQIGSCRRVLWGVLLGGGLVASAKIEASSPMAEVHSCPRTSCLPPVGGAGKAAKPRPLLCVLDPEGWRERALRGLGQISILSWKLRMQSVHTHPHPQIGLCSVQEFVELRRHPPHTHSHTVGTECKSHSSYFVSICGVGAGKLEAVSRGVRDGSPFLSTYW